ncbi:hypothetical protein [Mesorhizobium sp. AR02]|uniref:hypothetical protein n=1 Tax=Mesorhizobium sp. AR02 TaxID=2865837 RepID=UPI002961F5AD|nr:hypothetical protein [Mesorhizobium sp. AR02]
MQKQRRLVGVGQQLGQFRLAGFEAANLVLELSPGHTIQYGLNRSFQVSVDAFQLFALADDVRATLNPQPIHLTSEFLAEFLE